MDIMRQHDESTSLLPPESKREGYNYDATAAAAAAGGVGPKRGRHHHHYHHREHRPKCLFPRLAGLVVGSVAVAVTVAAAFVSYNAWGGDSSSGSGSSSSDLHPATKQAQTSLRENDNNIAASHGEARAGASSSSISPVSSL
ncbi:unnamed protein product, partial [Laminaria digitata]